MKARALADIQSARESAVRELNEHAVALAATMAGKILRREVGAKALGVKTHAFYTFGLDTPGNADFVGEYESRFGEVPTYFSVGSYDAAHLIDVVLQKVDGNTEDTDSLLAALDDPGALYSPGGFFEMDAKTNNAVRQFHMREVVEEDGKIINKVIADLGVHADPGE
jgi:branched-chain amino acid transport system substrate-binding protein